MATYKIDCGAGVELSLAPANKGQRIIQELYVLLNTLKGTVPCYRDFGIDSEYIHKPIIAARALYAAAVTEAVSQYIPDIKISQITFEDDADDPTRLHPMLEVTLDE